MVGEPADAIDLVLDFDVAHVVAEGAFELEAAAGTAAIIEDEDEEALLGEVLGAEGDSLAPAFVDALGVGAAVDRDDGGIGAITEGGGGAVEGAVKFDAITGVEGDDVRDGEVELGDAFVFVFVDGSNGRAVAEVAEGDGKRPLAIVPNIDKALIVQVKNDVVQPFFESDFSRVATSEGNDVEVAFEGGFFGAEEVDKLVLLVNGGDLFHHPIPRGKLANSSAIFF